MRQYKNNLTSILNREERKYYSDQFEINTITDFIIEKGEVKPKYEDIIMGGLSDIQCRTLYITEKTTNYETGKTSTIGYQLKETTYE